MDQLPDEWVFVTFTWEHEDGGTYIMLTTNMKIGLFIIRVFKKIKKIFYK